MLKYPPRFAAENIATSFGLKYRSGDPFYERVENGRTVVSYKPKGRPIPPHTYLSFARTLLDQWMDSPGHRKNILHSAPTYLGVSCVRGAGSDAAIPKFYCTQVFFAPLDRR